MFIISESGARKLRTQLNYLLSASAMNVLSTEKVPGPKQKNRRQQSVFGVSCRKTWQEGRTRQYHLDGVLAWR